VRIKMVRAKPVEQASELLDLLEGKLKAFKSFLSATELMKNAMDLQEVEKIEPLVAKREDCIIVINEIDNRINRIRNSLSVFPGEMEEKINTLTKAIENKVKESKNLNRKFEAMLKLHRDNTKKQLSNTGRKRNGVKGYAEMSHGRGKNQARFIDVKS